MKLRLLLVISLSVLTSGCITTKNFTSIPTAPSEFDLPYAELTAKYPEILFYKKGFRGFSINTPLAKDLVSVWGEPDEINTHIWHFPIIVAEVAILTPIFDLTGGQAATVLGLIIGIQPSSPQNYIWIKGKYCIDAKVHLMFPNYRKTVGFWKWELLQEEDKLSKDCKKVLLKKKQ